VANLLARLTMAKVPAQPAGTNERGGAPPAPQPSDQIPIFTNPKALTFPIVVGLVKGAWEALKALQTSWASSPVVPFVMCLVLGMAITVANLIEEKPKPTGWVIGLCVGLLNSLVIFGAVMGISGQGRPGNGPAPAG